MLGFSYDSCLVLLDVWYFEVGPNGSARDRFVLCFCILGSVGVLSICLSIGSHTIYVLSCKDVKHDMLALGLLLAGSKRRRRPRGRIKIARRVHFLAVQYLLYPLFEMGSGS